MHPFIFDFNGTLFPDANIHREAWKRFMARYGFLITDEIFDRRMYGPSNPVILRSFFGDLTDEQVDSLSAEKEVVYRQIVLDDPSLRALAPGAPEMLDMLKARGVPCAIATASIWDNVRFYMDTLGMRRWFDFEHVFYDTGDLPGKPDPAIYRLTMERLGYAPEDTTVVEDSLSGIHAAHGAGVGRIIAIDTTLGPQALTEIQYVDEIIHDFHGFERFIDG